MEREFFVDYSAIFAGLAVAERVAAWRSLERTRKTRKVQEVPKLAEPEVLPPEEIFREGFSNFDSEGFPKADADGTPLGKKEVAKMRKDFAICKRSWDKYREDRARYCEWLLYKARHERIEVGAEVEYPEDIDHLRPTSEKTQQKMRVIIRNAPDDRSRALWADEVKQVTAASIDLKCRKDAKLSKKVRVLERACFEAVEDIVVARMMALAKADATVWEGVQPHRAKPSGKAPKPPREPKGLADPKDMFRSGKDSGKYGAFDDDGLPTQTADGSDLGEKELAALRKRHSAARSVWERHQAVVARYDEALAALRPGSETEDGALPAEQREQSCRAAGRTVVCELVRKFVLERGRDLAVQVNRGERDPDELKALIVHEEYKEEEVITDPVLMAIRKFDEAQTNRVATRLFRDVFDALAEDELAVGSHAFYGDISDADVQVAQESVAELGLESDGSVSYPDLKAYLESRDVGAPGQASSLVASLVGRRIEGWVERQGLARLYSPRSWRLRLQAEARAQDPPDPASAEEGDPGDKAREADESDQTSRRDGRESGHGKAEETGDAGRRGDGKRERRGRKEREEGEGQKDEAKAREAKDKKGKREKVAELADDDAEAKREKKDKKGKKEKRDA